MTGALPGPVSLSAFLGASLILAATPGPGVLYIALRSATQGRRAGLASVAGVAAGNLANATGAALGLAAIFAMSAAAFVAVKWAGAAYLVWLGIRTLRTPLAHPRSPRNMPLPLGRIFRDAFLVALLNPKTTLFFAAFLPQFMAPDAARLAQSLALGALFVGIAAVTDTCYALAAGHVSVMLAASTRLQKRARAITGGAFIGLGVFAALAGHRPAR